MYLVVMIFNTISVSKCKLIDLINSSKKTEKIKLKVTDIDEERELVINFGVRLIFGELPKILILFIILHSFLFDYIIKII